MIVLSDSLCERIGKWDICPILKEEILGARLAEHLRQICHIIRCIESGSF
jgi:hypothetical protein